MLLASAKNDLVVNISDVLNKLQVVSKVTGYDSPQNVDSDIIPCMSKMGIIVHCGAAAVPFHELALRINRNEVILGTCQRIVDFQFGSMLGLGFLPWRLGARWCRRHGGSENQVHVRALEVGSRIMLEERGASGSCEDSAGQRTKRKDHQDVGLQERTDRANEEGNGKVESELQEWRIE